MRPGFDLCAGIGLDTREVSRRHLGCEDLAARGIDALADDHERAVEADDDFARGGTDDGVGHDAVLWESLTVSRSGYQGARPLRTPDRSMTSATDSSCR